MATLRLSRPWSGHPMVSISPPGAMIRQYKYGMLPLDRACSPIVATLILYMRWLGLLMANILSPGARIIQHKCGKRSDGGIVILLSLIIEFLAGGSLYVSLIILIALTLIVTTAQLPSMAASASPVKERTSKRSRRRFCNSSSLS